MPAPAVPAKKTAGAPGALRPPPKLQQPSGFAVDWGGMNAGAKAENDRIAQAKRQPSGRSISPGPAKRTKLAAIPAVPAPLAQQPVQKSAEPPADPGFGAKPMPAVPALLKSNNPVAREEAAKRRADEAKKRAARAERFKG